MAFNEDTRVKIPAILHLTRLGYKYVSLSDAKIDANTNIFTDIFSASLKRLNPSTDDLNVQAVIDELKGLLDYEDLGKKFYHRITQESKIIIIDYKVRELDKKYLAKTARELEAALSAMTDEQYGLLLFELSGIAKLKKEQFLSNLYNAQNKEQFAKYFDDTLKAVANDNASIFNVGASDGTKIQLFNGISQYIIEEGAKDGFCRAIMNKLYECNFSDIFNEKYDFFAAIFEYLIKDYNKDGGGKYAEYYTPRAVAKIMSEILVQGNVSDMQCYDPSAGTGSLLMSLAHKIGEDKCTIYSQDISQKSSTLLRMNLILNSLAHSLPNVIKGNTMTEPYHLQKGIFFDFIVSNPPFKLDFSDWRNDIDADKDTQKEDGKTSFKKRFFAGVPKIPNKDKDKMSIYLLFIQHIIASLKSGGKAAIVVPTGFITAQSGIEKKIREHLVARKWLKGVVSMPSNIFATTGTNVSVLFIDKQNTGDVVLVDASKLGVKVKEGKNQKTLLRPDEEQKIIDAFNNPKPIDDFSVVLSYDEIIAKNYSFAAGQYFDVKIEYSAITPEQFHRKIADYSAALNAYFEQSRVCEQEIVYNLKSLKMGEK